MMETRVAEPVRERYAYVVIEIAFEELRAVARERGFLPFVDQYLTEMEADLRQRVRYSHEPVKDGTRREPVRAVPT